MAHGSVGIRSVAPQKRLREWMGLEESGKYETLFNFQFKKEAALTCPAPLTSFSFLLPTHHDDLCTLTDQKNLTQNID